MSKASPISKIEANTGVETPTTPLSLTELIDMLDDPNWIDDNNVIAVEYCNDEFYEVTGNDLMAIHHGYRELEKELEEVKKTHQALLDRLDALREDF